MTPAQLTTLKNAINGDANVASALAAGDHGAIAAYYNGAGTGNIWKPSVSIAELNSGIVWSAFISLAVASQNAYLALTQGGAVDATQANVRSGFNSIFGAGTTLTNLTNIAQRTPTKAEALFTTSSVCSAFGLQVTAADVAAALG